MATVRHELTHNIWKRISAAGEEGTMWLKSMEHGNVVFVDHTTSPGAGPPDTITVGSAEETTAGINKNKAYPLREALKILAIVADDASDVYYVVYEDKNTNTASTAEMTADVA